MHVSVLGPLRVLDGAAEVDLPRPKERRLLALLVSRAGSPVGIADIVDELWPEGPPPSANRTVQSHIARLRKVAPTIETAPGGYVLRANVEDVDVLLFEQLVRRGQTELRDGQPQAAAETLAEADRLWHGPPYAEFTADGGFAAAEAARVTRLRVAAMEDRWDAGLRIGQHRAAVPALEQLVAEEPLRERLWGLLMLALYRCDRQADALATYQRAARTLAEELGIDPGPGLQRLHTALLRQDPDLDGIAETDLLARELGILAGEASPSSAIGRCPWLGLRSYDADDRDVFVGREHVAQELIARLRDPAVVTVLGSSGIGKTSLVRAGVVAALPDWRSVLLTPGDDPGAALDTVSAAIADSDGAPLLVVLDQAEELFTAAEPPIDRLLSIMDSPGLRLMLVIRADMAAYLADHAHLAERLRDTIFMVGAMTPAELTRVVLVPAASAGRHVEPALLGRILADLQGRESTLPLLATALEATWHATTGPVLTLESYLGTGGIGASLERAAEDMLAQLSEFGRRAVRRILLRLADSSPGQVVVRRRAPLIEIAPPGDTAASEAYALLLDRRLITATVSGVEVTHEILFSAWPRLREWLEQDAVARHVVRELATAAAAWTRFREDAALYRGSRLRAALEWASGSDGQLNAVESEFLGESERAEQRELTDVRRRSRTLMRAVVALMAALVLAVGFGVVAVVRTNEARAAATTAQAQRLGALALTQERLDEAMLLAVGAVRTDNSVETRGDLLATLLRAPDLLRIARLPARLLGLQAAAGGGLVAAGERNGDLAFLDATTLRAAGDPVHLGDAVYGVSFRPDGARVAAIVARGPTQFLALIDVATRREVSSVQGDYVGTLAYSPDGRWLAAPLAGGGAVVLPADGTAASPVIRIPGGSDFTVAAFAGSDRLIVADAAGAVGIWDIATAEQVGSLQTGPIASVAVSPDGATLVLGSPDGSVSTWLLTPGGDPRQEATVLGHAGAVLSIAFSGDGTRIATAADDGAVRVWDIHLTLLAEYPGYAGRITAISWSGDADTLYSAGLDGAVMAWDAGGDRSLARTIAPATAAYSAVGFAASSVTRRAVAAVDGGGAVMYTPDHPGPVSLVGDTATTGAVLPPAFSPDGRSAYTAAEAGRVFVWDVMTGHLDRRIDVPGTISAIAADQGAIFVALSDGSIVTIDPQTGRTIGNRLQTGSPWPTSMERSLDGRSIAVGGGGGIALVDLASGTRTRLLPADGARILSIAYAPDGSRIVGGGDDGVVRLWDAESGRLIGQAPASAGLVLTAVYAPDGGLIATGGTDGTVRLFDPVSLTPVGQPLPGPANIWAFPAFLDATTLLAGFADGSVRAYDITVGAWINRACQIAGRELTAEEAAAVLPDRQIPAWCPVAT
jgi:WD40 repeat protein/DNA-binding SARP family transcriptional activator